ncbi:MAG: hypothetical protein K2X02_04805 [Alphaproteobacteria bacterium]|nr:hypothetical protein [Alphaproteobacteria bacterium]
MNLIMSSCALVSLLLAGTSCFAIKHMDYHQSGIVDDSFAHVYQSYRPKVVSDVAQEVLDEKYSDTESLNLSDNYILDPGLEILRDNLWKSGRLPALRELDLSFNRVTSQGLPSFEEILEREAFQYLNIVGNPAASIESKSFFTGLKENHLRKLIWIPEKWIEGRKWTILLEGRPDSETVNDLVSLVHKQYYDKKRGELLSPDESSIDENNPLNDPSPLVLKQETERLQQIYQQAREGNGEDADSIGIYYLRGREGVKENKKKALWWFKYAANLGSADGYYNWGKLMQELGQPEEGMRLIEEAAKRWHFSAREMLGWNDSATPESSTEIVDQ